VKLYGNELVLCRTVSDDIDPMSVLVERHLAINECEESPIAAGANILAGDELGAALPNEDAASGDELSAKPFYSESLADAVATVADAALTFLMCHKNLRFEVTL